MLHRGSTVTLLHTSRIISLRVVKAVWGVRWPIIRVSGRKVILHKARWEASKIVWWGRGLIVGRWLLMGRERPSEMGRSLQWCTLANIQVNTFTAMV